MNQTANLWKESRPAGCTCQYPWQVCEVCRYTPRLGKKRPMAPMSSSAKRLAQTVEDNLITRQKDQFNAALEPGENGVIHGEQAAQAMMAIDGAGSDSDIAQRRRQGYPTGRGPCQSPQ